LAYGRAVFHTSCPLRRVEADLSQWPDYRYAFTIESPAARFTQSIRVNDHADSVHTDSFSAEVRGVKFENAWQLALGLSTAIYTSGQYDVDDELGRWRFRQGELGDWTEVSRKKGRFLAPTFDPDSHAQFTFASSCMVFEKPSVEPRRPVASITLKPASLRRWAVEIHLGRSAQSERRLMPLSWRMKRLLWNPIFDRIFER